MKNVINDCYIEAFGQKPTQRLIKEIEYSLPASIKMAAEEWGEYDTLVGDEICEWLRKNKELIEEFKLNS